MLAICNCSSKTSRWITNTKETDAPTRICDRDHEINEDIDDYVARKWTKKIGKPCYTPKEMIKSVIEQEHYTRPKIRYPNDLIQATLSVQEEEEAESSMVIGKKRVYEGDTDDNIYEDVDDGSSASGIHMTKKQKMTLSSMSDLSLTTSSSDYF